MNLLFILIACFQTISSSDAYAELNINQKDVEKLNTALVLKYAREKKINKKERNNIVVLHIFAMGRISPIISRWDLKYQTYRKKLKPWYSFFFKETYRNMTVRSILYEKDTKKLLARGNLYHLTYYEDVESTYQFKKDNLLLQLFEEQKILIFFDFISNKDIIFAITKSNRTVILESLPTNDGWILKTIDKFLTENNDEYF